RSFSDPLIKYTTMAVVAALIALSIIWWQSRNGAEPLSLVQSDTVTVETSEGETIIAQMDLSGAEETVLIEEVVELSEDAAADDASAEEGATDTAAEESASTEANADAEVAEEASPEEIGQAAMGLERFTITFTEECWVEVTDGRDIKVVANLKQAGEESLVEGLPPFKLMIGNAGGAVVTYQGENVDLKPYTNRNNIARFTLGE
ncbi:MAG: DUF4115 domain-containing protein, partial [Oceanospirillum sp.]|nr:DUF4115 domain-containing protein [Oceanospirillum sp.]